MGRLAGDVAYGRRHRNPDVTGPSLASFVKDVVKVGSMVSTDGWTGYSGLSTHGYNHARRDQSASGALARASTGLGPG